MTWGFARSHTQGSKFPGVGSTLEAQGVGFSRCTERMAGMMGEDYRTIGTCKLRL